jgi:hypothetical protein
MICRRFAEKKIELALLHRLFANVCNIPIKTAQPAAEFLPPPQEFVGMQDPYDVFFRPCLGASSRLDGQTTIWRTARAQRK